ncbi:hypothetical protein D3C87_1673490 [compost metagenome]
MQHEGLEIGLGEFDFAQAIKAFVRHDTHNGVFADHGAAEVGDFHGAPYCTDEKAVGASN